MSKKIKTFEDIPKLIGATTQGHRESEMVSWDRIDSFYLGDDWHKIILNPDFQRGHVWTTEQQRKFVEYCLRGGRESLVVIFNLEETLPKYTYTCIDGLQRLTAIYKFMHDKLEVFDGLTCSDLVKNSKYKKFPWADYHITINSVQLSKSDVLRFYLELNSNGTPHTTAEIKRVQTLLEKSNHK
jgi:uncharacterized protein with ParB-like and HNH nuclease domain